MFDTLLRQRARAMVAAGGLAALVSACSHPWEDYLAEEAGGGSTTAALCARLCGDYAACIGSANGCAADCEAELPSCSVDDLATIAQCAQAIEVCEAFAQTAYETCLVQVTCYSPP